MNHTKDELSYIIEETDKWAEEQLKVWFFEKLMAMPFELLDKVTPSFIHKKVGDVIDGISKYIEYGGNYLSSEKTVLGKYKKELRHPIESIGEISTLSVYDMDKVARSLQKQYATFATVQGATTGFGGIFTLSIDIPVVLGTSLKTLQEIAMSYGYEPNDPSERLFISKCLQFAYSDYNTKKNLAQELSEFEPKVDSSLSQLKGWRDVILSYRDTYSLKKLLQTIPVLGFVFGAYNNRKMIKDISEVGIMFYRKRRAIELMEELEEHNPNESK